MIISRKVGLRETKTRNKLGIERFCTQRKKLEAQVLPLMNVLRSRVLLNLWINFVSYTHM